MSILQFWFFWQQRGPSLLLVMPAALSRNNDILECNFLDRKVNKIIVLVAATLVLISIVLVGLLNNLGFDNSKGITRFTFHRNLGIVLFEWSLYYCHTCQCNLGSEKIWFSSWKCDYPRDWQKSMKVGWFTFLRIDLIQLSDRSVFMCATSKAAWCKSQIFFVRFTLKVV